MVIGVAGSDCVNWPHGARWGAMGRDGAIWGVGGRERFGWLWRTLGLTHD